MKYLLQKAVFLCICPLLLAGCFMPRDDVDVLRGQITLWHSWPPTEAVVLERSLNEFQKIHPDVHIITVVLREDQVLSEFTEAGMDGLGPSLLIGTNRWIGELADAELIRPLTQAETPVALFNSRARDLVQFRQQLFGVPLFLNPRALYYNRGLVTEPPETLEELLQQASAGRNIAFVPGFEEAYWGIQAFGQGLFDEQGDISLADSGFEKWLAWLDEAQHAPGVILNVDDASLLELFISGQVAYYIAGPEKQAIMAAMIDEGAPLDIGVVPLPGGPYAPAGPLLPAETILLYAFSSRSETRIAVALANFLSNQTQSIRFMREIDRTPANPAVRVDQRIYPIVNGFARQAETAVVIPNEIPRQAFFDAGNRAYISVLSGASTPAEAICHFGWDIAALPGYTSTDVDLPSGCETPNNQSFRPSLRTSAANDLGAGNG